MGIQQRWNDTFSKLVSADEPNGRSCPPRRADESETDHLRRLSIIGKRYVPKSEQITAVKFSKNLPDKERLPDAVVEQYSEQVRAAVERNLMRTDNMRPHEMREMVIADQDGLKWHHFVGPDSFVKNPVDYNTGYPIGGRPCRLVVDGLGRKHSYTTSMPPQGADAATRRAASGGW
jgi:hypothetical protein